MTLTQDNTIRRPTSLLYINPKKKVYFFPCPDAYKVHHFTVQALPGEEVQLKSSIEPPKDFYPYILGAGIELSPPLKPTVLSQCSTEEFKTEVFDNLDSLEAVFKSARALDINLQVLMNLLEAPINSPKILFPAGSYELQEDMLILNTGRFKSSTTGFRPKFTLSKEVLTNYHKNYDLIWDTKENTARLALAELPPYVLYYRSK